MARPRADTGNFAKEPHSISLKVLRLSRPSLAQQHPLPRENDTKIPHAASLAYPSNAVDQNFILSTSLGLPPSFGSAHVGETFSCALCANNELPSGQTTKTVSGTRILAEMQTPSQAVPLELYAADDATENTGPGSALQRIIRFDLKEEGNHVLAVNVTYTETASGDGQATGGRVRSFRKLYQFLAQPCMSVRTKTTELKAIEVSDKTHGPYGRATMLRYVLEAQLENVSDAPILLQETKLQAKLPFKSTSLNWDAEQDNDAAVEYPSLKPRDIIQVAFLVEQQQGVAEGLEDLKNNIKRDGRAILGQLAIQWRTAMGERGSLSTGNLLSRRKAA
ncbi:uncharacterized protein Z520_06942 [Fonsecaea multimorphosa CBS 102226]|uniref:DUF974 domain protein n=1 Tax=Fonsecaea multimorphosa CBS 102226 TaxID=1442371 RepID=A0A0D2H6L6_9EURO|nr:uncharacterized protein Z520_06942 [Fonsecaea multimorphosa CBS 102226]KIX97490.1 hypothetical protein Z520_06942 [Fonsecaea multimorphosa CBS 102226]OAL23452.1 hypothetical protein AYO22_06502 [Fonsecaea multimorphosa]